jgi:hypothetical protein
VRSIRDCVNAHFACSLSIAHCCLLSVACSLLLDHCCLITVACSLLLAHCCLLTVEKKTQHHLQIFFLEKMASQQKKSWRSPNKMPSSVEAQEVTGKTIEAWGDGTHRGFVANAVIANYSMIQGPKTVFLNANVITADETVYFYIIKVYKCRCSCIT